MLQNIFTVCTFLSLPEEQAANSLAQSRKIFPPLSPQNDCIQIPEMLTVLNVMIPHILPCPVYI